MAEHDIDLETAVQALRDEYGDTVAADEHDGERMMEQTLQDRLGVDHSRATRILQALMRTGAVRFVREEAAPPPFAASGGGDASVMPTGGGGRTMQRAFDTAQAEYWSLGPGPGEPSSDYV